MTNATPVWEDAGDLNDQPMETACVECGSTRFLAYTEDVNQCAECRTIDPRTMLVPVEL